MNYKYTKTPEIFAGFFLAENKITHHGFEYIIHLGDPRCFIKFSVELAMFASFEQFYNGIAEVQWLDGAPNAEEQQALLVLAWNYLAIEERILEDDMENIDEEDDW